MSKRITKHGAIQIFDGWVLVSRDESHRGVGKGDWYIAWLEVFTRKRDALEFAAANKWPAPFKAVRASLAATP